MLSGNALLKRPIITHDTNTVAGMIDNVLIDPFSNRLVAFATGQSSQNPRSDTIVVPWTGIKAVKPDRVIVWATSMLVRAREMFEIRQLFRRGMVERGTRFVRRDGETLGEMSDVYFDERTGELLGYELVGGTARAGRSDRGFLPAPDTITLLPKKNVVQLPPDTSQRARDCQTCTAQLVRALHRAQQNQMVAADPAALARHLLSHVVGCAAQRTVITQDGYLLIVEGQAITRQAIHYARQKGTLPELLTAVHFDIYTWLNT